ncbi:CAP domain-containing protein [Halomonas sp. BC04]|uniref:CAP domain-containing protein n=1 Tax=Halomonas sp. BC04 TaxID=1403540 RepID=UPI0003ED5D52|nr:CAP domain-containing protein [Halomonas sp. BC04]EWH03578.1 SCP/PR1 domain-containing protein [Halomonas sp. BC04]
MQSTHRVAILLLPLCSLVSTGPLQAGGCEPNERQRAMLERVNEVRSAARQCGDDEFEAAEPLAWSCRLAEAAANHSRDMAENAFFDHADPDGVGVNERVSETGYDWMAVGENIAAGQSDVATVLEGWLSSPGHCTNIMRDEFTEMGAAVVEAEGSDYSPYWTQVLARPR